MNSKTFAALAIAGIGLCAVPSFQSCSTTQSASSQMEDAEITSKIKARFIGDPDVKALDISVETEEGVVYLTGRVETQFQKDEAERIARETSDVRDVVNHIQVGDRT
jgi:osmotically-inducible protein OsmY